MDGNGRWAVNRGLPRIEGHRRGVNVVKDIVTECRRIGVKYLTLYAFSSENWSRPEKEVSFLMRLLKLFLLKEKRTMMKNNIRFNVIGRYKELPAFVQKELTKAMKETSGNKGMVLSLALNYGGRIEIVDAVRRIVSDVLSSGSGMAPENAAQAVNEDLLSDYMYTGGMPDPDLLIRTSGELRVSNFLLWQIAYSEFYVTQTLWPDFTAASLHEALEAYRKRDRRFGGI